MEKICVDGPGKCGEKKAWPWRGEKGLVESYFLASKLLDPESRSAISVLHPNWSRRPPPGNGGPGELLQWKVLTQYRSFNSFKCPEGSTPKEEGKNLPGSW